MNDALGFVLVAEAFRRVRADFSDAGPPSGRGPRRRPRPRIDSPPPRREPDAPCE